MANPSHFQIQIPLIISCENIIITKLNLHLLTMYRTVYTLYLSNATTCWVCGSSRNLRGPKARECYRPRAPVMQSKVVGSWLSNPRIWVFKLEWNIGISTHSWYINSKNNQSTEWTLKLIKEKSTWINYRIVFSCCFFKKFLLCNYWYYMCIAVINNIIQLVQINTAHSDAIYVFQPSNPLIG